MSHIDAVITNFYKVSDTKPCATERDPYLELFTEDATLTLGLVTVQGHDQIQVLRQQIWAPARASDHRVKRSALVNGNEILVNGTVDQHLLNGKTVAVDWASHMIFEDDKLEKLSSYQVYIDASKVREALL